MGLFQCVWLLFGIIILGTFVTMRNFKRTCLTIMVVMAAVSSLQGCGTSEHPPSEKDTPSSGQEEEDSPPKVTVEEAKQYLGRKQPSLECSYTQDKEMNGEPYYEFRCKKAGGSSISLYVHKNLKKIMQPQKEKDKPVTDPK
ncbi:hypothetical protein MUN89_07210 [Halobacillus salinarum]|uniref:Lipoprotein n=1 Tax=Halobacillus salinarum TaxID=2932257 RepID=A0ABY4EMM6_9BACI|nr:hypothetical protein [Halobacillus salinarum]UOQ45711.1 hypothetical protein MUN89_07210 [Halobacillus salinarum]